MTHVAELLLVDAGTAIQEVRSLKEADDWASTMQAAFRPTPWQTAPPCGVVDALSAAASQGGDAAAALAAAIAAYGPQTARSRARRIHLRLVEGGVEVPEWVESLGIAEPEWACQFEDEWGEERLVCINFTRPDGTSNGVIVFLDRVLRGFAHSFGTISSANEFRLVASEVETGPYTEIDLAEARAIVEAGLRQREGWYSGAFGVEEIKESDQERYETDDAMLALVEQRVALLPDGGEAVVPAEIDPDGVGDILADFLSGQKGAISHWEGEALKEICQFNSSCYNSDLLRWSPKKTLGLLIGWEYTELGEDREGRKAMESLLPKWLEYSAARRGLDPEISNASLYAVDKYFKITRRKALELPGIDHEGFAHFGCMEDEVIDYFDREAVRKWAERR